jgi:hypothetical protein
MKCKSPWLYNRLCQLHKNICGKQNNSCFPSHKFKDAIVQVELINNSVFDRGSAPIINLAIYVMKRQILKKKGRIYIENLTFEDDFFSAAVVQVLG